MRVVSILIILCVLCVGLAPDPMPAQSDAPYLYYYSDRLRAFVIERADGTETRLLGRDAMKIAEKMEYRLAFGGPGWSPSGKWFAWTFAPVVSYYGNGHSSGRAVHSDNTQEVETLSTLPIYHMVWSPKTDKLFLMYNELRPGLTYDPVINFRTHPGIYQFTDRINFAVFDPEQDRIVFSHSVDNLNEFDDSRHVPARMKWIDDERAVVHIISYRREYPYDGTILEAHVWTVLHLARIYTQRRF